MQASLTLDFETEDELRDYLQTQERGRRGLEVLEFIRGRLKHADDVADRERETLEELRLTLIDV